MQRWEARESESQESCMAFQGLGHVASGASMSHPVPFSPVPSHMENHVIGKRAQQITELTPPNCLPESISWESN